MGIPVQPLPDYQDGAEKVKQFQNNFNNQLAKESRLDKSDDKN